MGAAYCPLDNSQAQDICTYPPSFTQLSIPLLNPTSSSSMSLSDSVTPSIIHWNPPELRLLYPGSGPLHPNLMGKEMGLEGGSST